MAGKVFVGTSGWNYKHWMNGTFYPEGQPQSEWLEFYAERFGTVEINNSFYRLPPPETFAAWAKRVPADFIFAVKASRYVTHIKRLKDPGDSVKLFLKNSAKLGKKLGPILFQLPPRMKADLDRLEGLRRALSRRRGLKIALEFRDERWLNKEVYDMVERAGWTICLADWRDLPRDIPVLGPFCYIRRHGTTAQYASLYSDEQVKADAAFAARVARAGRDVYVYYNNDAHGFALKNALTMIASIEPKYLAREKKSSNFPALSFDNAQP
ncbi:MAG TPA: DUF72 domain-containing protein [Candidatus Binatia bacterium]|nr:DUF72 domain-containing protein [Candidatus Binatia bacterium]